jgi:hypothetical protein
VTVRVFSFWRHLVALRERESDAQWQSQKPLLSKCFPNDVPAGH